MGPGHDTALPWCSGGETLVEAARTADLLDIETRGVPCSGPDGPVVTAHLLRSSRTARRAASGWFWGRQDPPLHRVRAGPGGQVAVHLIMGA